MIDRLVSTFLFTLTIKTVIKKYPTLSYFSISLSSADIEVIVEVLTDQNMDAGYHLVTWNADNHASGMYFVKMHAGNYISTQKLMLVK